MLSVLGAWQVTNRYSFKDLGHLSLAAPLGSIPAVVPAEDGYLSFDPSIHPVPDQIPVSELLLVPFSSQLAMNNSIFAVE